VEAVKAAGMPLEVMEGMAAPEGPVKVARRERKAPEEMEPMGATEAMVEPEETEEKAAMEETRWVERSIL
jgi:hypothetical protein